MPTRIRLEVCVESLQSAVAAEQAGADRIELNSALPLGGLTPTVALLQQVRDGIELPVICMVRPRAGDFFYSPAEFDLMLYEAESLLAAGSDGLAVGCLDATGRIDGRRVEKLRQICQSRELIFHRAFDCTTDLDAAAQQLIDLGVDRILTSGGEETAIRGQSTIAKLQSKFGQQIEILPGSGISSQNVVELLQQTGCRQVHGTFRAVVRTGSQYKPPIHFNQMLGLAADEKYESCAEEIRRVIQRIQEWDPQA